MKKLLFACVALILVCGIVGCGKTNESESITVADSISETTADKSSVGAEEAPTEIDIFDNVEITVNESEYESVDYTYPASIDIKIKSTNPDVPDTAFEVEKTSATIKSICYTVTVDEAVLQSYLEENNYVLKSSSKSYETNVSELETYLLSADLLTEENMQIIYNEIKKSIEEQLEKINGFGNDYGGEVYDTNIQLIMAYAVLPEENIDFTKESGSFSYQVYMIFTDDDKTHYYVGQTENLQFDKSSNVNAAYYFEGGFYENQEKAYAVIESEVNRLNHDSEKFSLVEIEQ